MSREGNEEAAKVLSSQRLKAKSGWGEITENDEHSALFEHISLL
jgi:hypothetical protein